MSDSPLKQNKIVPLDKLSPHPRNYRSHPEAQVSKLVSSLVRFGQGRSIVIQDGPQGYLIVAGHGIVEAAKKLQYTELRADILPADWTSEQVEGYLVADNMHSQDAEDNETVLAELLQEQQDAGFDLASLGTDDEYLRQLLEGLGDEYLGEGGNEGEDEEEDGKRQSLADRFIVPPFSVLDARQGYWQERKKAWIALGIQSELGRGDSTTPGSSGDTRPGRESGEYKGGHAWIGRKNLARTSGDEDYRYNKKEFGARQSHYKAAHAQGAVGHGGLAGQPAGQPSKNKPLLYNADKYAQWLDEHSYSSRTNIHLSGTSIFDPVLCELAYSWFSPPDGTILDPFAGGSVRGIVAAKLGRRYVGIDLRSEQITANEEQARAILDDDLCPRWITGDSRDISTLCSDVQADLIFTCPPYYDLEVYSDDPLDLSAVNTYEDFLVGYRSILEQAIERLKDNCFVCIVVGDIRDKKGFYRNFVSDTITACQDAGAKLYNEAILVTQVGSLPIRVGKQFTSSRKLGKTHQNVLVFCKGNPVKAVEACGPVVVEVPDEKDELERAEEVAHV